jgi:hypothetical protein
MRQCSPVSTVPPAHTRFGRATRHVSRVARVGARIIGGVIVAGTIVGACGGDEAPSAERFCGEVAANKDALTNPELGYDDDIEPLLDLYRDIADLAPLGVADDWNQLVSAYETASTVVIGDQASEQEALTAIYSSEKSAAAVEAWLRANCAVEIGPVFTIVPQGTVPVVVPPADSSVPPSAP